MDMVTYGPSDQGRECWTEDAAWWECCKPGCDCGGIVVRHGVAPSAEERTNMQYVRDGDPPILVVEAVWARGTEYALYVDGHIQRTLLMWPQTVGAPIQRHELTPYSVGSELVRKWIDFLVPLSDFERANAAMWIDEPHGLAQAKARL